MKFEITRTSCFGIGKPINDERLKKIKSCWYIELNTLEELMQFIENNGHSVVIERCDEYEQYTIEIYDTYRE